MSRIARIHLAVEVHLENVPDTFTPELDPGYDDYVIRKVETLSVENDGFEPTVDAAALDDLDPDGLLIGAVRGELLGHGEESDYERFRREIREIARPAAGGRTLAGGEGGAGRLTLRSGDGAQRPTPDGGEGDAQTLASAGDEPHSMFSGTPTHWHSR